MAAFSAAAAFLGLMMCALPASGALAGATSKDGKSRTLVVYNMGNAPVITFNASPSSSKKWSPDYMPGAGFIGPGKARNFNLDDGKSSCVFDLRAQFADGNIQTVHDADICKAIAAGSGWMVSNQD